MCLGVPAKVIGIKGTEAIVTIGTVEYTASLLLMEEVAPGDFVLLHAGFVIEKLDPLGAAETIRLFDEITRNTPE